MVFVPELLFHYRSIFNSTCIYTIYNSTIFIHNLHKQFILNCKHSVIKKCFDKYIILSLFYKNHSFTDKINNVLHFLETRIKHIYENTELFSDFVHLRYIWTEMKIMHESVHILFENIDDSLIF